MLFAVRILTVTARARMVHVIWSIVTSDYEEVRLNAAGAGSAVACLSRSS